MSTHAIRHHFHFPVPHFPVFVIKIFQFILCFIIIGVLFTFLMLLSSLVVVLPLLSLKVPLG